MLAKSWTKPSISPYASPVLFVQKKTGKLQMCVEFHVINANTKLGVFPLTHISNILDKLGKVKCSSSIHLATA